VYLLPFVLVAPTAVCSSQTVVAQKQRQPLVSVALPELENVQLFLL
jgi:hypothetical protein